MLGSRKPVSRKEDVPLEERMRQERSAEVGVAVATLDRPDGLARCLDAILAGERLPAELIVVDQGEDDRTGAVVAERSSRGLEIRHIPQRRLGLSASRNAAFTEARSAVLAVTDDDCVPSAGWVAAIHEALVQRVQPPAALTGPVLPLEPEGDRVWAVSSRTSSTPAEFTALVAPWRVGTGANFALRRDWLDRVGQYDQRLGAGTPGRAGEDMDLIHRLLAGGAQIHYEPRAVVYHERRSADYRRSSRAAYGHGIGAYTALRLCRGDRRAAVMMARWLGLRAHLLGRELARGRLKSVLEELLVLSGTVRGAAYGLRVGSAPPPFESSSDA
jgi:GT2 family glycosyltransferase